MRLITLDSTKHKHGKLVKIRIVGFHPIFPSSTKINLSRRYINYTYKRKITTHKFIRSSSCNELETLNRNRHHTLPLKLKSFIVAYFLFCTTSHSNSFFLFSHFALKKIKEKVQILFNQHRYLPKSVVVFPKFFLFSFVTYK